VVHRATTATKPLIGRLSVKAQIVHLFTVAAETGGDEPLCLSTCFRCLLLLPEDTEDLFIERFPVKVGVRMSAFIPASMDECVRVRPFLLDSKWIYQAFQMNATKKCPKIERGYT
jgi:hypothetical protein